jgi:superfamily II DNA or RNA helicase
MAISRFLDKNPGRKVLVIVPTDYLKTQWEEKLQEWELEVEVGIVNSVIKQPREIDFLILDEAHVFGADSFRRVFEIIKYKMILCLTGTIERLDGKQEVIKKYAPICDEVTMDEAIAKGWLAPYIEYMVLLDVDLTEYKAANKRFLENFAMFNYKFDLAMACFSGVKRANKIIKPAHEVRYEYAKSLCHLSPSHPQYYQTVKELNSQVTAAAFQWSKAMREKNAFIKNHPKKLEVTRKILEARKDKKAITFSATIKDAEAVGIGYTLHSGKTKKKRALTMEEFNKLDCGVLNTSKALDCGADLEGLSLAVILSGSSSEIQKKQRLGRTVRFKPGKTAEIFNLVLRGTTEEKWAAKASSGLNYNIIDEEQLERILNGEIIKTRKLDYEFSNIRE